MVIDFVANEKPLCDFLYVANSNCGPVSHRLGDTVTHNGQTPLIRFVVDLLWTCCGLVVDLLYNISTCCGFVVDFRCHSQNSGLPSVLLHFMAVVGISKDSKDTFTISAQ